MFALFLRPVDQPVHQEEDHNDFQRPRHKAGDQRAVRASRGIVMAAMLVT
jgi:hypothetical protein